MKRNVFLIITLLVLSVPLAAQPQIQGPQSGVLGPGNYLVVGDISVPSGETLTILPSTVFLHNGYWYWRIYGTLQAVGTAEDSIKWLREEAVPEDRWAGLRFQSGAPPGSEISYSVIEYGYVPTNGPSSDLGGCLFSNGVPLTVSRCRISFGDSWWGGGGICASYVDGLNIDHCLIADNEDNEWMGGGILLINCSNVDISYNEIIRNTSTGDEDICGGGGIRCNGGSDITFSFNQIYDNIAAHHGAGLMVQNSDPVLINNTITQNQCLDLFPSGSGGGLYVYMSSSGSFQGVNNIIYGNIATIYPESWGTVDFNYCCCSQTLSGTGNITSSPQFVSPGANNFQLSANSPCIDAGDPASPLDPDSTQADMGALYFDQSGASSPIDVEFTYISGSPVPTQGGTLIFDIWIENVNPNPQDFDAWVDVEYENGEPRTVIFRSLINFQPAWVINRPDFNFPVPAGYAAGDYMLYGRVGEHPDSVWDESGFPFVKSGNNDGTAFIPSIPLNLDDPFDRVDERWSSTIINYKLLNASPNPFNPTTVLSYELRVASCTSLTVFDVQGRKVATLVDGFRDAGLHQVTFDASNLASGVYLYKLEANDFSAVGKMTLLK